MNLILCHEAPDAVAAAAAATAADTLQELWGVDLGGDAQAWSVTDDEGAWLLLWFDASAARDLSSAAPAEWSSLGWRRARLASLDGEDRAALPADLRVRLSLALD